MAQRDPSVEALGNRFLDALYSPARAAVQSGDWQAVEMWADRVLKLGALLPPRAQTEAQLLKDQAVAALRPSDAPPPAATAAETSPAESIVGTWSGTVDQPGVGKYPVTMSITSLATGTIDYPTLKCGGTLLTHGSASSLTYTETITYGADRCFNDGKIALRLIDVNQLQWEYVHPTGGPASARLNRIVSSQQTSGGTSVARWRALTERARIRTTPSTAAEILATLPAGTLLPLAPSADPEGEWLAVSLDGRDAFIASRLTRPADQPPESIDGAATVVDTATLEVGSSVVRLFGIAGEGGEPAQGMALFVQEQRGRVSCLHREAARYVCHLGGRDVAEVALFNGAARAAADAPESYRQREAQAREAARGMWAR
jgi:hypothetical protein